MKDITKREIKEETLDFARKIRNIPFTIEELERAYPFHTIFFPDEALISFKQQRSLVTKMGQRLHPKIAEIIAKENYSDVHRNYKISSKLDISKIRKIDEILNELDARKRKPDHEREILEINKAKSDQFRETGVTADLYVGDFEPGPLFFEIKTPMPKKEDCVRSKRRLLIFQAIYTNKNPQAFVALHYNPYIYREKYSHWPTKQILDIDKEVLIGKEMWNKLGGEGTYEEILDIIEEVKEELKHG
jgi:type II restriction enzyme